MLLCQIRSELDSQSGSRGPKTRNFGEDFSCKWRQFGAIISCMSVSMSVERPRQSLRLDPEIWKQIDRERAKRAGSVSRNTWITEAILEKLASRGQRAVQKEDENA